MNPMFSDQPGAWERHLRRKHNNPLFGTPLVSAVDINHAQQRDAAEVAEFMARFEALVKQAAELEANAEADVVLKLKEQLDKAYEQCAGLAGNQNDIKDMLKKLVHVIMQAMWQGVGNDVQAHSKLQSEIEARQAHFELLEYTLVADLLRPESPIEDDELVPTLLSESSESVKIAMQLFSAEQQLMLYQSAQQLVEQQHAASDQIENARLRLADMQQVLQVWNQMPG